MPEAVFHRLDYPAVIAEVERYVSTELATRPEVRRVVLIGSLARGDWGARSDADLVVIVDAADRAGLDRSPDYGPRPRLGVSVDVFVYTRDEIDRWGPRFRGDVEAGRVLYERLDGTN